jgi:hypothetical protein
VHLKVTGSALEGEQFMLLNFFEDFLVNFRDSTALESKFTFLSQRLQSLSEVLSPILCTVYV